MILFYELLIRFLTLGIRAAAFFHPKARRWVLGRRDWHSRYATAFQKKGPVLWVHAASLGEFEQGRPLIEAVRTSFPGWQIVLTFFSPSGYEIRKNYPQADFIGYLPADTRRNARDFLDLIRPDVAIFVKYEFWANYLLALKQRSIPTLLVSALFRSGQPFFQWYGGFWRRMLGCFTHFFLQNERSAQLLQQAGFQNWTVAGDTRVDRVLNLAENAPENAVVKTFAGDSPVLVAGSSWEADENIFLPVLNQPDFRHLKVIIAPHEPSEKHLAQLIPKLNRPFSRYSAWSDGLQPPSDVLLIDNVGMLNTLYRYGKVAYIGGGFGKGIHNTLEPAAFGLPVIFGPRFGKFEEARQLVARGGAFSIRDGSELATVLQNLQDPEFYQRASAAVRAYLEESRGATDQIIRYFAGFV